MHAADRIFHFAPEAIISPVFAVLLSGHHRPVHHVHHIGLGLNLRLQVCEQRAVVDQFRFEGCGGLSASIAAKLFTSWPTSLPVSFCPTII
jgi:hypothetical protein